jgi:predicted glycogen debranching enzyme
MKLSFEGDRLQDFNFGATKEWIEVNNLGAYCCSTLYGMNSRSYHGLLAVPVESMNERVILLSKFEESIFIDQHIYEISTNQYAGGIYPDGYKYLSGVSMDPFPRFTFLIGNRRIEKTLFLLHDQNILVIRYACKNQGPPIRIILKPIIAYRKTTELSHQVPYINTDSYLEEKMVRFAPKAEIPALNIYYLKGEYTPAPLWYYNYKYQPGYVENLGEGQQPVEDLFNPGFFSCTLEPYDTFDLFISPERMKKFDFESSYRREKDFRRYVPVPFNTPTSFISDLSERIRINIIPSKKQRTLILPAYHTYPVLTWEILMALPGLSLVLGDRDEIMHTIGQCLANLADGLLPLKYPFGGEDISDRSAMNALLFINFLYYYYRQMKDISYLQSALFEPCLSIIDAYSEGTRYNIYQDEDHLIFSGDQESSTSWIPLRSHEGRVLRYGKLLEINALWYNALRIMEYFGKELKKNRLTKRFNRMAVNCRTSFLIYFWDENRKRFYDMIRENFNDLSFRVNQIFLIALPYPIVDTRTGQSVLQQIEDELVTPCGLRSLSYRDAGYIGTLKHPTDKKNPPYYLGAVWPWTVGMYVDAVLHYRGKETETTDTLREYLNHFSTLFYDHGNGYISEIFAGDSPHYPNGTLVYNLNLIELLRAYYMLDKTSTKK